MARLIFLIAAAFSLNSAFAGSTETNDHNETRLLRGEFIRVKGETGEISFDSAQENQRAMYRQSGDTICFSGLKFLNDLCIQKSIAKDTHLASLRVSNSPRGVRATLNCTHVNPTPYMDLWDLRGCQLSYELTDIIRVLWSWVAINGRVTVKFQSDSIAIRFVGDMGTCQAKALEQCQTAWLFNSEQNFATMDRGGEVIGIFKVGERL